jgi:hypothetical protein
MERIITLLEASGLKAYKPTGVKGKYLGGTLPTTVATLGAAKLGSRKAQEPVGFAGFGPKGLGNSAQALAWVALQ